MSQRSHKNGKDKGGRPKKSLTRSQYSQLEKLVARQMTGAECAAMLGLHYDTLNRILQDDWAEALEKAEGDLEAMPDYLADGFSKYFERFRQVGIASLRNKQYEVAMAGSERMLIHLGEQYMNQRRKADITSKGESIAPQEQLSDDELASALEERGLPTSIYH